MTTALIYGGRDWDNQAALDAALDRLHAIHAFDRIINGGQASRSADRERSYGADWQAAAWAQKRGIPVVYFFANWAGEGKAAGPLRNQRMLVEGRPHIGVQFPGGRGTKDMRRRLQAAGVLVVDAAL